jgi:acetylornithine deacetylase
VTAGHVLELLEELVLIPSTNASLGGVGEAAIGLRVEAELREIGAETSRLTAPGVDAPMIVATMPGVESGPHVMLCAHMDTVPDSGQPIERLDDRLLGRGTADTKASLAAMLRSFRILSDRRLRGPVTFAATVDEEAAMLGAQALAGKASELDAIIVGEPTSLVPVRAHNGCLRFRVHTFGPGGHASRSTEAPTAIITAARLLTAAEDRLLPRILSRSHPEVGPGNLACSIVDAGTAANVRPETCTLHFDRRLIPGESAADALAEFDSLLEELAGSGHRVEREAPYVDLAPVETSAESALVRSAVEVSSAVLGRQVTAGGVSFSTDACHLAGNSGVPAVVLGPGSIDVAHGPHEWVPLAEVEQAVDLYVSLVESLQDPTTEQEQR